jgi:hypothetical protein
VYHVTVNLLTCKYIPPVSYRNGWGMKIINVFDDFLLKVVIIDSSFRTKVKCNRVVVGEFALEKYF